MARRRNASTAASRRRECRGALRRGAFVLAVYGLLLAAATRVWAVDPPGATPFGYYQNSLQAPARMATDAQGNLYVSEPQAGRVVVFNASGEVISTRGGFARPLAIAVDSQQTIYLGEEETGRVTLYDVGWSALRTLGTGDGEFVIPSHIAIDPNPSNDVVYVSDSGAHQIKVYSGGLLVTNIGSRGTSAGQFVFPAGVFVSPEGELFVVDQNNDRVQVFDLNGGFRRTFSLGAPGGSGKSGRSQGIVGDSLGRLYIADTFQGQVKVFDVQGTLLSAIGSFGSWVGQLRSPTDLAMTGDSRLFVASANNGRVERFGIDSFSGLSLSDQTVPTGTNTTLFVTLDGPGPFTYQWLHNAVDLQDGPGISGSTTASLALTGLTPGDSGTYSLVVSGPSDVVATLNMVLTVFTRPPAPRINSIALPGGPYIQLDQNSEAGVTFRVEVSTDLEAWSPLTNIVGSTGIVEFPDPDASTQPRRFYRLRWGL